MSSYEEIEPQNNPEWQSNITNMLSFKHFNNLNNEKDNDGIPGKTLGGNYCIDLCTKAKDNEDGTGGSADAELDARMNNEDNNIRNAALCEKSNAIWRAKMLCNSCLTRTDDANGFEIITVKGWDYLALIDAYQFASKIARQDHVPVLVHVTELTQPLGHSDIGRVGGSRPTQPTRALPLFHIAEGDGHVAQERRAQVRHPQRAAMLGRKLPCQC